MREYEHQMRKDSKEIKRPSFSLLKKASLASGESVEPILITTGEAVAVGLSLGTTLGMAEARVGAGKGEAEAEAEKVEETEAEEAARKVAVGDGPGFRASKQSRLSH